MDRREPRRPGELPTHARGGGGPPDRDGGPRAAQDDGLDRDELLSDRLGIYLNDHLTFATAAVELARRIRGSNEGTPLGDSLGQVVSENEQARETLRAVMRAAGVGEDRIKKAGGFLAEKVGRLKLNGSLISYSPLSRLLELDGLYLAASARRALWLALAEAADPRLVSFDFADLAAQAEAQLGRLDALRRGAAPEALAR